MLTTVLGYLCAMPLPRWLGIPQMWGAAGLTASAGVAGWAEMLLLRAGMNRRIGRTGLPVALVAQLWSSAICGAAVAWAIKLAIASPNPILNAVIVLGPYGVVFFLTASMLRVPEARETLGRVRRLGRG